MTNGEQAKTRERKTNQHVFSHRTHNKRSTYLARALSANASGDMRVCTANCAIGGNPRPATPPLWLMGRNDTYRAPTETEARLNDTALVNKAVVYNREGRTASGSLS